MDTISYSYKVGIKEEVVNAMRGVFGSTYPDPEYAGKIHVTSEYPTTEIQYPLIVVKFNPTEVKNMGVGHYDIDENFMKILHWRFMGNIRFEVYALTPIDRDRILSGLSNLFAFGQDIPAFADFGERIRNQEFVTLVLMTHSYVEGGESAGPVSWDQNNELVFSNSITLDCWGEFFTNPTTGGLVEIDEIDISATVLT